MFSDFDTDSEDESMLDQAKKKRKECEVVHSSLDYHSIKVPPLVEYTSIESYCEQKGEMLVSGSGAVFPNLRSISSPVVFKTPQPPQPAVTRLPHTPCHPYGFFSLQELSCVQVLTNWTNLKVCTLGLLDYTVSTKECHLVANEEDESCKLLLEVSDFKAKLTSQELQQVYGILSIHEGKPKIIVNFFRNLGSTDLHLFVESYKLMQKYVPKSIKVLQKY